MEAEDNRRRIESRVGKGVDVLGLKTTDGLIRTSYPFTPSAHGRQSKKSWTKESLNTPALSIQMEGRIVGVGYGLSIDDMALTERR